MQLHPIDAAIVISYLLVVAAAGWLLAPRAGKNLESYFLAGKRLPWYVLGISHGVSSFDVTGAMWFALMLFTYGVKGVYILWIWPVFSMVFRMVYLSKWVRRSRVLTGAEWIHTRFGSGGRELAHLSVVFYAMVGVFGFLSYGFQGIGRFAASLLPWGYPPETYAVVILGVTAVYLILGGMYSVVATDMLQYLFLLTSAVGVSAVVMATTTPESVAAVVPDGWLDLSFGWKLDVDWSGRIPFLQRQLEQDDWSLFTVFVMLLLFKGWLVSLAGPSPGFGIQRVLATRSPKEAALESGIISPAVLFPRFLLIAAITVLALVHLSPYLNAMQDRADFEQILPLVVGKCLPTGLRGIVMAGMVAAFLSHFYSTIHGGTAYIVNDLYRRYLHPNGTQKQYVYVSYACMVVVVLVGIAFGFLAESISSVTKWLVSMLFGGYTAPNVLKWHWWRFNGYGFCAGMVAGVAAAVGIPLLLPDVAPLHAFPLILLLSSTASVTVCLLTPAEDPHVLDQFYLCVRPWGLWGPVYRRLLHRYPELKENDGFLTDMMNCAVGIVWQTSIVLLAVYLALREYGFFVLTLLVFASTTLVLKKTWYDRLGPGEGFLAEDGAGHNAVEKEEGPHPTRVASK